MARREFGSRAQIVAVGRDLFLGNLYHSVWSASFCAGVGTVSAAAVGARVGNRAGLLRPDTNTVRDSAGNLYLVGAGTGKLGTRV